MIGAPSCRLRPGHGDPEVAPSGASADAWLRPENDICREQPFPPLTGAPPRMCSTPVRGTKRARSHRRLKALLMAAEALLQAWSSGMARKAALKGSAWMGPP